MLLVKILGSKILLCAHEREGQTQLHIFLRRISQSEIRNSAAAEKPSFAFRLRTGKRGRAKIPSPQPLSFLPARAFSFCRAERGNQSEFCSKKVRASFNNSEIQGFLRSETRSRIAVRDKLRRDERATKCSSIFKMSILVGVKGLEPSAFWSQTRRSSQLSYTPKT